MTQGGSPPPTSPISSRRPTARRGSRAARRSPPEEARAPLPRCPPSVASSPARRGTLNLVRPNCNPYRSALLNASSAIDTGAGSTLDAPSTEAQRNKAPSLKGAALRRVAVHGFQPAVCECEDGRHVQSSADHFDIGAGFAVAGGLHRGLE